MILGARRAKRACQRSKKMDEPASSHFVLGSTIFWGGGLTASLVGKTVEGQEPPPPLDCLEGQETNTVALRSQARSNSGAVG